MNGSSSFSGDYKPHEHSMKTLDYTNFMAIGRIPYPVGAITPVDSHSDFSSMIWRVSEVVEVAKNTYKLLLRSDKFRISDRP
mmetsp:Transcript_33054/g.6001  ORF Transcript_33054/g.6001 Transcript_33054/m.6001 type:complete len:82 (+) Transcript_33054:2036-2281(+)